MTKIIISILLLLHGLIHLMGFFKAFNLMQIEQLSMPISKPAGVFWLITAVLFFISALLYLFHVDIWSFVAVLAIIISQMLIISVWSDAKFGTIANVLILLVSLSAIGHYQFNKMIEKEKQELLNQISPPIDSP